jgi:hypothetical protein
MLELLCTTAKRNNKQTPIKPQNRKVRTVEFTRIPLFPAGKKPNAGPPAPPTHP